jgi:RPA family protein
MSNTAPLREVAQRAFAREINAATHTFRESDDDRAPVYVLLPTGTKANRVFVVGTLTETTDVGTEDEYWQGRVIDPIGTVFIYAGQYQPDAAGTLRDIEPPAYVAVVGKPRTYETDDGTVNVSVRPEHLTIVDETTRDRWVAETAQRTLDRLEQFDEPTNEYAQLAREEYGETGEQYRHAVIEAVDPLKVPPGHATDENATAPDAAASESTASENKSTDVTAERETVDHGESADR